jgi:pimeloyl-ACP methyl ester carboxylesterase
VPGLDGATPEVRFAQSGDVSVAYAVNGDGPIDIVYVQGAISHLEVWWELPIFRTWCERIGEFARLIRFDKRGMGMSDRVPGATSLETRMDDIRAVMDAAGSEQAVLIGHSEGGPLSMLFAAAHPERTRALVLAGAEVRELRDEEWPWGESTREEFEAYIATVDENWDQQTRFAEMIAPSLGDAPWVREWWRRLKVNSCTPGAWKAFARMAHDIDVRHVVPHINVPTLIYHTVGDRMCSVENGRWLARNIAGSKYVERPGADHLMWAEEADPFIAELREFVTGERHAPPTTDRVLATVLFTDIVDSTVRAAELGDRRWRELLAEHHAVVRGSVEQHGGREVDMAGDGVLAIFDGPARAIGCAQAIQRGTAPLGLGVRAGVHTGEIEKLGDGIAGIAVHTGARVAAAAGPGEVWVSAIVPQLTAGSGLAFEDRGSHQLKGVPGEQRLYAVA